MKIDLIKFKNGNKTFIRSANKESEHLFKHCANGESIISLYEYNKRVERLIWLHGVNEIYIRLQK